MKNKGVRKTENVEKPHYDISLNQFAKFSKSTENGKRRIIIEQQKPNPHLIPWYQLAKARMRKSIKHNCDLTIIDEAIKELQASNPEKKWQKTNKAVSIEALKAFKNIEMPRTLYHMQTFELPEEAKMLSYSGVNFKISPDLVFRIKNSGKPIVGALKLHVSKGKPFDTRQSILIASLLYMHLNQNVKTTNEIVLPEFCFSLDIFKNSLVSSPLSNKIPRLEIRTLYDLQNRAA